MLRDARAALEDGATLDADLCVVGGGAAGIALARALARADGGGEPRVVLLEGGGVEYDPAAQALYEGSSAGLPYFALDACRLRYLGGSTNHWGGRCRTLDPIDLRPRPWVPRSGWPLAPADLAPYYERAAEVCRIGPPRFDAAPFAGPDAPTLPFDPAAVESGVWHYAVPPTLFGEAYRGELERAGNVEVLLHANAVELEADAAGSTVTAVRARCLGSGAPAFRVRARAYVLACGGLENPRLLLASDRGGAGPGLGDAHGHVGRCFMEHPHLTIGTVALTDPDASIDLYYKQAERQGIDVRGRLRLSDALQEAERVLNLDFTLFADLNREGGYPALRRLLRSAKALEAPDDLLGDLALAVTDLDDTLAGLLGQLGLWAYDGRSFRIYAYLEQQPNPDSRVTLDPSARDALGLPRLRLDWRLTELDKRTLLVGARTLAREFGRTGLGRVRIDDWLTADAASWPDGLSGGFHHMGTTRMAADPRDGVVDRDCRVHGVANLYVAGSSVFPTAGAANPTLTLVALALRLADHLRATLTS